LISSSSVRITTHKGCGIAAKRYHARASSGADPAR
jgi:hypothetical protein